MYCAKCGAFCNDNDKFCASCGSATNIGNQQEQPQGCAPQGETVHINEFFPCGIMQPPGTKVFGVVDDAIIYGNEKYDFKMIDNIFKVTESTPVTNGVYNMNAYGKTLVLVYRNADKERAQRALQYAQYKVNETHGRSVVSESIEGLIYDLEGVRGRHIKVFEDRVVISVTANFGSFITGNISDGEKTIYFCDCIGVQFKESGLQIGYLQFETASRMMNNSNSNFFNENTFTWDTTKQTNEFMREVSIYCQDRVKFYKQPQVAPTASVSGADELKKFKELLDMGIITQEEFDKKKQQILGF